MHADVYKWFTETSGLGFMEQAALLINPKAASKEEEVAEAIEVWEEKVNRLARHGEAYQLPEAFRKVALRKLLTGKVKEHYEMWQLEKFSYEELLKNVKEHAKAKKLDSDAFRGKSGVSLGTAQAGVSGPTALSLGHEQPWTE